MSDFKDIFPRGGENTAFARYFVGQSYGAGERRQSGESAGGSESGFG